MNTYLLFMLSEIRKDKMKLIKDPIKRMSYNGSAREVVRMIALALGFKIHEDEYGISAYGGNAIRIADHCTYMQTWVDRGTWNAPIRLDVVIEEEPTQAVKQVKKGYDFTIVEFVYNITEVDTQNARTIAYDIRNVINGNQYANNARGERRALKSTHNSNENKQYNKKRNMKRTIRLTESELKNMITESVKMVLREGMYGYPDDCDQMILAFENDNECMKYFEDIARMLDKKYKRGIQLNIDLLANSSVLKKFQQFVFRKFKQWQENMTRETPYNFRAYVANRLIETVENGEYDFS